MAVASRSHDRQPIEALLAEQQRAIDVIVARGEGRALLGLLEETESELRTRLLRANRQGLDQRWTGQQIAANREVVWAAVRHVRSRLGEHIGVAAEELARKSMRNTVATLKAQERRIFGVVPDLAIEQALRFDHVLHGVKSSVLRQYATSVDRYGARMIGEFERQMQLGLLSNDTTGQMIARIVGHRGPRGIVSVAARVRPDGSVERIREDLAPEGLLRKNEYWAQRIVRTELLNSANQASQAAIAEEAADDFPDLKQLLIEHFDQRTGWDSYAAHGQIRAVGEMFEDGAGRQYLAPPGRPNDRATLVPWRDAWGAPKGSLAPKPVEERRRAAEEGGGLAPTPPPRRLHAVPAPKPAAAPPPPPPPVAAPPRWQEGKHVGDVRALTKHRKIVQEVLDGVLDAPLLGFLERHPIKSLFIASSLGPGIGGLYSPSSATMALATNPAVAKFGRPFTPGTSHVVASSARSMLEARQAIFTHELGHHIHHADNDPAVDNTVREAYRVAMAKRSVFTAYGESDHHEYFAEGFAAYRYRPTEFKAHDPGGFAMVEAVLRARGILP